MLTVAQLMNPRPATVGSDTILREAAALMNQSGYRHLPVVDDGNLVGMLTERDIRLAVNSPALDDGVTARAALLDDLTVGACMTPEPVATSPDADARAVAELLTLHKFGALPVVEGGRLVGIVSVIDFLRRFAERGAG